MMADEVSSRTQSGGVQVQEGEKERAEEEGEGTSILLPLEINKAGLLVIEPSSSGLDSCAQLI